MSEAINSNSSAEIQQQSQSVTDSQKVRPTKPPGSSSGSSKFDGTVEGLKAEDKEVFDLLMQNFAQKMCTDSRKSIERIKKINREERRKMNE